MTQKTVFLHPSTAGSLAVVQKKINGGTTGSVSSIAATFTSTTAAGNLLVAIVNSRGTTTSSVTDSAGNTYVQAGSNESASNNNINFWYAKNALANAGTVTAHFAAASTYINISLYEVSGADTSAPFDCQSGATASSGTLMGAGGLPLSLQSQEIIFAGGSGGSPPIAGGAGYTSDNFNSSGDATLWFFSEYHIVTASENPTATQNASNVWVMSAAAFQAPPAVSTTTLPADFGAPWQIIAIGAGSGGYKYGTASQPSSGGAGGGFSQITDADASATAGQTIHFSVGAGTAGGDALGTQPGAGGDTWLNLSSGAAPTLTSQGVLAKGGGRPQFPGGGTGGQASAGVGSTKHSGGSGGSGNTSTGNDPGGTGGGAAGAQGDGGAGAVFGGSVAAGGGGGGSGGGGSGTVGGAGSSTSSTAGGGGGNNAAGVGGGSGGTGLTGHDGTLGGGGGGAPSTGTPGKGGPGADYTQTSDGSTAGPGGGGASAGATSGTSTNSADGGLYGGGGGGATAGDSHGGAGKQGIVILIYTPTAGQPATGMTDLRIPQRPANLTFDQSPYNLTLYAVAARPFIPSDTAQPVRLRISIPDATWPNLVLGATSAAASPFIPYASAQLVRLRLLLPDATWPNLVLQQGPAPQGGPFQTADTAQMVRFVRWAPREFTVYSPALIVPQPALLSIVEAANARDFIDVTTTFNASLIEAVSASDRIDAVLIPARRVGRRRYQVIDPRFMTIQHWSRMTAETILQAGFVPAFTDEAGWQQWAQYVRQLPDLAGLQIPDPRGFGSDWQSWGHRLNESLRNAG